MSTIDSQDKLPDKGMQSGILEKAANYWYYYKWQTLVGAFVLIFLIICVAQCAGRISPDAAVVYAGPKALSADQMKDMQDSLNRVLETDLNGDGKVQVDYAEYSIIPNGGGMQQTVVKQLDIEVMSGDNVIYFISPQLFEQYFADSVFMPIKDALGYEPDASVMNDAYAIRLSELEAYEWYNGIGDLPKDTLIAVKNRAIITTRLSDDEKAKLYNDNMTFLKKMLDYRMPVE